jgi:hypothetical protein
MKAAAVLISALALVCCAAGAKAEGFVPVEGRWTGTTSAALPVSFEVKEGQIVEARFTFHWGYCGTFEAASSTSSSQSGIDANGHWKYTDSRGPLLEGTFVAPDRVEGAVIAPPRSFPSCPSSEAHFQAVPGALPPPGEVGVLAVGDVVSGELARRPHTIDPEEGNQFYFYAIQWQSFGGPVARATARAYTRGCCGPNEKVKRPRATLRLTHLTRRGDNRVYARLHYVLHGPLAPYPDRRGSRPMF